MIFVGEEENKSAVQPLFIFSGGEFLCGFAQLPPRPIGLRIGQIVEVLVRVVLCLMRS